MKRLAVIAVFLSLTACERTVTLSHVDDPLLLAQSRPVCMDTEIDQACVQQNQSEYDDCVSECIFDCPQIDGNCVAFCQGEGVPPRCVRPDPEDCRVEGEVDPIVGECAAYDSVKNCSRNLSGGLETLTLEMTVDCNATLGSKWQCEPCKPQSLNADRLGNSTLSCPGAPGVTWTEDCISQTAGNVLSDP